VVAAFRRFRARHPEALLVTAWQNIWPATMQGIDLAGHVHGVPATLGGTVDIASWLERNGVPPSAAIDVGLIPNHLMADIVRACDVAVFPNRAEGGTNLVAMECIAAGVPTVASWNTGHLDLGGHVLRLPTQVAVPSGCQLYAAAAGWGESNVRELVESMEHVTGDTSDNRRKESADIGAAFGCDFSWRRTVDHLLEVAESV
jgi:glycosyltransferase involved in cell wall biosynthesis